MPHYIKIGSNLICLRSLFLAFMKNFFHLFILFSSFIFVIAFFRFFCNFYSDFWIISLISFYIHFKLHQPAKIPACFAMNTIQTISNFC